MFSQPQRSVIWLTFPTDRRLNASLNHSFFVFSLLLLASSHTPFLNIGPLSLLPKPTPPPHSLFPLPLPCLSSSWLAASLTWKWTSSSRRRRALAAWWSCCPTARLRARLRSGACSPLSSARACVTCKPAPKSASFSRCCSRWAQWTIWLQVTVPSSCRVFT